MLRQAGSGAFRSLSPLHSKREALGIIAHHHPHHHVHRHRSFCAPRVQGAAAESTLPSSSSSAAFASQSLLHTRPRIAQIYLRLLGKHPILTKSVTAGTIYFFADVTSQGISMWQSDEQDEVQWDVARTLRMVAAGLFMSGPTLHVWFNFVSRCFPKRDLASTLKKMAMGQIIYGPTFTVVFFSLNAFVQGESIDEVVSRLKRDFLTTIRSGLMYWPACDFITYRYVPVHLQHGMAFVTFPGHYEEKFLNEKFSMDGCEDAFDEELDVLPGRKKRKRLSVGECDEFSRELCTLLESNSKILTAHIDSQNLNCHLDRTQRKEHAESLVLVLGKLAEALGKIADKL